MFEVTEDWVKANRSGKGGWNRQQLELLGVKWPPIRGWLNETVGRQITDVDKQRFESLQGLTQKLRNAGQSPKAKL